MKTSIRWLLACVLALAGCTDDRGLIVTGSVEIVDIPDGKTIWLGLWVNNASMDGPPDAYTTLADAYQESQGEDQAMYPFGWRTFLLPERGARIYVGGYFEDSVYADGLPNEGVRIHAAKQNPLVFESKNLKTEGNGAYEYKTPVVIDFQDSELNVQQAIGAAYEALVASWTHVNPDVGLEDSLAALHPAYHDDFGNDYSRMSHWLAGDTTDLTLYDVPMLGRFVEGIDDYAENFAMASAADVTVEEQSGNVENAWFSYSRDSDNVSMKLRFQLLKFTPLDGAAYLSGMRPQSVVMQDGARAFELTANAPYLDATLDAGVYQDVQWLPYGEATTYAVDVAYWDRAALNYVRYSGPNFITANPNVTTYRVRFQNGSCVGEYSLCVNTAVAPMDRLYRIRVTPADSTTATGLPYSEIFIPGLNFPH